MSLGHNDPRLANATTGIYLTRTFNIEPRETNRFMPGVNKTKTYSERLRMGIDCDEVYPGIIIGKPCSIKLPGKEGYFGLFPTWADFLFFCFND